jgi:O-antigen/teichoic acid export membrane protein
MRLYFDPEHGPEHARALYGPAFLVALVMAGVAATSLILLHQFASLGAYWPAVMVMAVLPVTASMGSLSTSILQAEKRAGAFLVIAAMRGGLNTALGVVAVLVFARTAGWYLAGYTVALVITAATATALVRPGWRFASRELIRRAARIGVPTIAAAFGTFALALADRFVVQITRSHADVGRYQLAYAVGGIVFSVIVAVNFAWLPQVLGAKNERARIATIADVGVVVQAGAVALIAGVALLAPLVFPLWLPHTYHPYQMAIVASVVALGAITYVPYIAGAQLLLWHERTISLAWITPLAVVVELAAGFLLVGSFGLIGVAVASGLAYVFQALCVAWTSGRLSGLEWLSPTWVLASVPGLVGWILGLVLPHDGVGAALRVLCLVALLAASGRLLWVRLRRSQPAVRVAPEPA